MLVGFCDRVPSRFQCAPLNSLSAFLAVTLLFVHAPLFADEPSEVNVHNRDKLPVPVLAVMENGRRLRSGQYHATGLFTVQDSFEIDGKHERRRDVFDEIMESDFDFDSGQTFFRCKRSLQGDRLPGKMRFADEYRWYLSIPGLTAILRGNEVNRTALLYQPRPWEEIWRNEINSTSLMPVYDPRLLGWSGLMSTSFEDTIRIIFQERALSEIPEENGIHRIEYRHHVENDLYVIYTWWCDEKQGWQPVRYLSRVDEKAKVRPRPKNSPPVPPLTQADVSWEQHGDVWVVKSLVVEDNGGNSTLQLAFDWKNVNQRIPGERFDWKNWRQNQDYHEALDLRLGVDRAISITTRRGSPYERDLEIPLTQPQPIDTRYWFLVVNLIVIAFGLGWLSTRLSVKR